MEFIPNGGKAEGENWLHSAIKRVRISRVAVMGCIIIGVIDDLENEKWMILSLLLTKGVMMFEETATVAKPPEKDTAPQPHTKSQRNAVPHNQSLGLRGEDAAARYLEHRGFEVLERNWVCPVGEADIIATDENVLVFVEVKTRSNIEKGLPEEAVGKEKRARYERIAALFLQSYDAVDVAVRFDVVSILVLGNERALLRHHVNAFSAGE